MSPHDDFVRFLGLASIFAILIFDPIYAFLACLVCGFVLGILREKRNPPKDIFWTASLSIAIGVIGAFFAGMPIANARALENLLVWSLAYYFSGYFFGRSMLSNKFKWLQVKRQIEEVEEQYARLIELCKLETGFGVAANETQRQKLRYKRFCLGRRLDHYAGGLHI